MPIHDWTTVDAGAFHAFHIGWLTHLSEALNNGLLPEDYYAMPEQHAGRTIPDVLTLHVAEDSPSGPIPGSVAVAEAPPQAGRKLVASPYARGTRRTLAIRHVSGHRLVAIIELVSRANKDRGDHVHEFVEKIRSALRNDCHVLLIDLYRPGKHDPTGMAGAVWEKISDEEFATEPNKPYAVTSFVADDPVKAYVEQLAVGDSIPDMPLFLDPDYYINTPLQETYDEAFHGMPAYWRKVVEESIPD